MPVPKWLSLSWPARVCDRLLSQNYALQRRALSLVPLGTRVLFDVGCGGAAYHKGGRHRVVGLDANPRRLAVASKYCDTILLHDLRKELPTVKADCVLCLEVIEHLPRWAGQHLLFKLHDYPMVILSTPRMFFRVRRNGYEAHLSWWSEDELMIYGYRLVAECDTPPSNIYVWRRDGAKV